VLPSPSEDSRAPPKGRTRRKTNLPISSKNIPVDGLIDDFLYRRSQDSYFIQIVDLCVYGLLRSEKPHPAKEALGINTAFDLLQPICQKECTRNDPRNLGIIRTY
jgi:hypothetical protein